MSRSFNYAVWLFLFILLSISFSAFAQDVTATAEPPTDIATVEPSPVATEAQPTDELPTAPPATTEAILPSETPVLEQTAEGTAPAENTAEAIVEQTEAVITTPPATATEAAPLLPEPVLVPVLSEAFHSRWNVGTGWELVPQEQGFALQVTNSDAPVVSNVAVYDDVAVEMLVQTQTGTLNLHLRQTETDGYVLSVNPNGQVDLHYGELLLATTSVGPALPDQWRQVRFSAMGDTLRVAIDTGEVIALRDVTPVVAAGAIFFNTTFPVQSDDAGQQLNTLLVDNIRFWMPEANLPTSTPTTIATSTDDAIAPIEVTAENTESLISLSTDLEGESNIVFGIESVTVNVASSGDLINAIIAANNRCTPTSSEATIIELNADIILTNRYPSSSSYNSLPTISCDITITSPTVRRTIRRDLNAPTFRIFEIASTGRLVLNNVKVTGGLLNGEDWYSRQAGAIYNLGGQLEIVNSSLLENGFRTDYVSPSGAAIYSSGGIVRIVSSAINSNFVLRTNNQPHNPCSIVTLQNNAILEITGTTVHPTEFRNNIGCPISHSTGRMTIANTIFTNNSGISIAAVSLEELTINDTFFQNNQGNFYTVGRAILIYYPQNVSLIAPIVISNVVISENQSRSTAQIDIAIYASNIQVLVNNSIIANNTFSTTSTEPQAVRGYISSGSSNSSITISNSCIVGHTGLAVGTAPFSVGEIDARDNWWGHTSGPSGAGGGLGDQIDGNVQWDPPNDMPFTGLGVECDTIPVPPPTPPPTPPATGEECTSVLSANATAYDAPDLNSATSTLSAATNVVLLEIQHIVTDTNSASWYKISVDIGGTFVTKYLVEGTILDFSNPSCLEDDVTEVTYETLGGGGGGSTITYQDRPPAPQQGFDNDCLALLNGVEVRAEPNSTSPVTFTSPQGAYPQVGSYTNVGSTTWYFVNYFEKFIEATPDDIWRFYLYSGWFDGTSLNVESFPQCGNLPTVSNPPTPPPTDSSQPGVIVSVNQPIVFTNSYGGDKEIYIVNGFAATPLTDNSVEDTNPSFSPTGQQIAFQSRRNNQWGIYIMNVDGTNETPLVINNAIEPDWYPDTTTPALVFARGAELYRINADGTGESQLTTHGSGAAHDPAISNDGDWIVYTYNDSLYAIAATCTSSCTPTLLRSGGIHASPAWSPDNQQLAFSVDEDLYTATVDYTTTPPQLTDVASLTDANSPEKDVHPFWTSNGQIIFESDRDGTRSLYEYVFDEGASAMSVQSSEFYIIGGISGGIIAQAGEGDGGSGGCTPSTLGVWPYWSILRDYPSVTDSIPIEQFPYDTSVSLLGKYWNADEGYWWWHLSKVENTASEGWMREDVVQGDSACASIGVIEPFRIPPPPPPGNCEIQLKADPSTTYTAYSISVDGSQYLISQINTIPQQWVSTSFVIDVSDTARACDPGVLGAVRDLSGVETSYINSLAFYVNNFHAPVNRTFYTNIELSDTVVDPTYDNIRVTYNAFKISQYYYYGGHDGLDMVYRPPSGNERFDQSRNLGVYAPYDGVVVEAGPDSLTYTGILRGPWNNLPAWIIQTTEPIGACANTVAGQTCLPTGSYFFQIKRNADDTATITVALNYNQDNNNDTDSDTDGLNNGADPVTTLTAIQFEEIASLPGFTTEQGCNGDHGCAIGGGRQLIIWHEAGDGDATPDIATVYYHVTMEQYLFWKETCSASSTQGRVDIWNSAIVNPNHDCWIRRSTETQTEQGYIGRAEQIGFSTGSHLHFGVAVDRDNPTVDSDANNIIFTLQGSANSATNPNEEIDPAIAVDIHMPPGKE